MRLWICLCALWGAASLQAATRCDSFTTAQDVLACALEHHPDIRRSQADVAYLGAFTQQARQRVNPELESESTYQKEDAQPELKWKAAYFHTFELGDKRSARIYLAKTRQEAASAQLARVQEEISVKTVRHLFRLRQIEDEQRTVQEALHTFERVIRPYRNRKQLTPEQHVSLNVFTLAQGDYRLRETALIQEQEELKAYFELATGAPFEKIRPALPPSKKEWPVLSAENHHVSDKNGEKRQVQSDLFAAKATDQLASGEAWPNMKLGPMIDVESGRGQDSTGWGAALSLPLPLYQQNAGGKALARGQLRKSEVDLQERQKELNQQLRIYLQRYQSSVRVLEKSPSVHEMEIQHARLESFYERGLVSAPLVIEAHRQMVDLTKSQNDHELRAIETLWSIYALEGRILEVQL
jgi:outer membrane protein, heavy metal efflux system